MHDLPYDYCRFTPVALKTNLGEAGFNVKAIQLLGGWDPSMAWQIGLWLTNSKLAENIQKILKLLAWPIYSCLLRKGNNEYTEIRNHQSFIGLAALAEPIKT